MTIREDLKKYLQEFEVDCPSDNLEQLALYAALILKFNPSLNLISRTQPEAEIVKQIVDSAAMVRFGRLSDQNILDIGSGGGIPGLAIKILSPDIKLCSLDSNPGKITFQEKVCSELNLKNCEFTNMQISEFKPSTKFDIITCKAFGKFAEMFRLARQALSSDGRLIFYASDSMPAEIENNLGLDFNVAASPEYFLPEDSGKRRLIIIKKE